MTKNTFLFIFLLILSFPIHAQLEAHLIDGEGWAKGDYVEIGINSKGVFGANTSNRPPNFHLNRESDGNNLFGFIANPLKDNWVDYDGDFFTPGTPEEGFTIEVDGVNYSNNNSFGFFQIPGQIVNVNSISSDCFDDTAQIIWEGNVSGLNIKRYYSVTKDGLFIQMNTVVRNLSPNTKEDIYFLHNVDPDNNITLSGFYDTDMSLISQASSPTDDVCLVKASQEPLNIPEDMDGSFVNLYAKNPDARVSYGGFDNRNASAIWNGFGVTNAEGSTTALIDEAISIAFNLGDLAPNETISFTYYYILEDVDSSFVPFIVNAFQQNPTTCLGNDGKIIFSGLQEGLTYTLDYVDDGVAVPSQDLIADENGNIELIGLDSGAYSNIRISFTGCSTSIDTVFELTDPLAPNFTLSKEDFTTCDGDNGKLIISNLTPSTEYTIQFTEDAVVIPPANFTANNSGQVIISGLDQGTYSDFIIEQFNCTTSSNEVIEIQGPVSPVSYPIPDQFYCDDDYDYLTSSIDFSELETFILGVDNASDFDITFYETEQDITSDSPISTITYQSPGNPTYILYAQKTDRVSNCSSYIPFNVTINIPVDFELNDGLICLNSDDTVNTDYELPILSTGLSESLHTFEWYLNNELLPSESSSSLTADTFGVYSVKATIIDTGCDITKSAEITPSGPPRVLEVNVISTVFSENHSVEINASGYGNYIFGLDDGPLQAEPLFTNVSPGYHLVKIIDTKGCGIVTEDIVFVDYMKFFTPNNDGKNDYWQIIGISELIEPKIYIHDRYGKLLKQLSQSSIGWDGAYNGSILPSSDYWFTVVFKDENLIQRQFSSHFTLKR
ncbi:T9SS type B sorting domain-containing protein [Winogradskyella jejuensis]|uniref:Gliding motility-associated C-terminal domain-containing protein n=1 Tax=Winogradskyella jejuensis TaxID=1089305 RepID=A0A1M5MKA4_9FLAO|nr:T9SS type B sorting domain-containing protein [Winogradskyella jejuensis]SHG77676.1 gliding motility-associated C-terminal domain-containing protein [Winogradskyella jejuensis]